LEDWNVTTRKWWSALAAAGLIVGAASTAGAAEKKEIYSFAQLRSATPETARAQAEAWLKAVGKDDAATQQQVQAVWAQKDVTTLQMAVETIRLGSPEAAQLLDEVTNLDKPAPKAVPELIKAAKDPFFRANLALTYAKALSTRRVYEQALESLQTAQPEQVVDPASYFFHKAVAEHALLKRDPAGQSVVRLLEDVADAPDRYKMVGMLMLFDMQGWKKDEKDLSNISRLMDNVERRLDLARGGSKTQDIQKKIVFRLDELIKELENQCKGNCQCNGGQCPNGGQAKPGNGGSNNPSAPMQDSNIATNSGPGNVDEKKLRQLASNWGSMPEKERAKAMADLTRDLPPKYREVIENYFKSIAVAQKP